MATPAPLGDSIAEAIYSDTSAAKSACQEHAKANGFAVSVASSSSLRVFYACTKGGVYNPKSKDSTVHPSHQRRNTGTIKTDCPYKCVARCVDSGGDGGGGGGWNLETVDNNHNHGPAASLAALPQHRIAAMSPEELSKVKQMRSQGINPKQILNALRQDNSNSHLVPRDIIDYVGNLLRWHFDHWNWFSVCT
jgi:hypothetical protein